MAIRCVLFDLFGTLVQYDAEHVSQDFTRTHRFVRSIGIDVGYDELLTEVDWVFAHLDAWSIQSHLEFSMVRVAETLFERLPTNQQVSQGHHQEFVELYIQEWAAPVLPVPGVAALLSRCRKRFKTGIITNTHYEPMVRDLLKRFKFTDFDVVMTSVDHGRPKPHANIFLATLDQLQLEPNECVYVGDTYRADYVGANQVGMPCYLIGHHARVPREYQIPSVIDLPLHLLK